MTQILYWYNVCMHEYAMKCSIYAKNVSQNVPRDFTTNVLKGRIPTLAV